VTWNVTCTYSQFLAQKTPTCCVSLSSFYNDTIVNCPTCSCGCQNNVTHPGSCVKWVQLVALSLSIKVLIFCKISYEPFSFYSDNSPYLQSAINGPGKITGQPLVQCTSHMCPIRVHWHVKLNYKDYWRVKVTITNFNYRMNYSDWNLVAQHPNFNNITKLFSFNYKPLTPYGGRISKSFCELFYLWFPNENVHPVWWGLFLPLQMIPQCSGEWSSTMISLIKLVL
jgi:hypothetical protein